MVYPNYGICYLKYFHPRRTLTYSKKDCFTLHLENDKVGDSEGSPKKLNKGI